MSLAQEFKAQEAGVEYSPRDAEPGEYLDSSKNYTHDKESGDMVSDEGTRFKEGIQYADKPVEEAPVESGAPTTGIHETFEQDPQGIPTIAPVDSVATDDKIVPMPAAVDEVVDNKLDPSNETGIDDPTSLDNVMSVAQRYKMQEAQRAVEAKQAYDADVADDPSWYGKLQTGAATVVAGGLQGVIDLGSAIGIPMHEMSEDNLKRIAEFNAEMNSYADKEDIFTWTNAGVILPTLVTLPVAVKSKVVAGIIEGSLAYADNRGHEGSVSNSLMWAAGAGLTAAGMTHVFDILADRFGSSRTLAMLQEELNYTDSKVQSVYKDFAKTIGKDPKKLTPAEKAMAQIAAGHERGAAFASTLSKDASVRKALRALVDSKNRAIRGSVQGFGVVASIIKPIKKQRALSTELSKKFKEYLFNARPIANISQANVDDILQVLQEIPEMERTGIINKSINILKKVSQYDANGNLQPITKMSVEDLFDIREAMSKVTWNSAKKTKSKMSTKDGQKMVDDIIAQNMPASGAALLKQIRVEQALTYAIRGGNKDKKLNNVFGMALNMATEMGQNGKPLYTYTQILDALGKGAKNASPKGVSVLKELEQTVGSDAMRKFENGLVKELIGKSSQSPYSLNLRNVNEVLSKIGLVTPEGKALKRELKELDKVFSSDSYFQIVGDLIEKGNFDGSSITADLVTKLKYSTMSGVWGWLRRQGFSDNAVFARKMLKLNKMIGKGGIAVNQLEGVTLNRARSYMAVVRESVEIHLRANLERFKRDLDNRPPPPTNPPSGGGGGGGTPRPPSGGGGPRGYNRPIGGYKRPGTGGGYKRPTGGYKRPTGGGGSHRPTTSGYTSAGVSTIDFPYDTQFLTTGMPVAKPNIGMDAKSQIGSVTRPLRGTMSTMKFNKGKRETVKNWKDNKYAELTQGKLPVGHTQVKGTPSSVEVAAGNHVERNMKLLDETRGRMSPAQQKLAEAIIRDNPQTTIQYSGKDTISVGPWRGVSQSHTNQMFVAGNARDASNQGTATFLHELIHQATVSRYREDHTFKAAIDSLHKHLLKANVDPSVRQYWKDKPEEFLAEAFGNQNVAEAMSKIPAPLGLRKQYPKGVRGKIVSMWDAFTYTIASGVKGKSNDSAYELLGDILASNTNTSPAGAVGDLTPSSGNWGSTFMTANLEPTKAKKSVSELKTQLAKRTPGTIAASKKKAKKEATQKKINAASAKQKKNFITGGLTRAQKAKEDLAVQVKLRTRSGQALNEVLPKELQGNVHAIDVLDEAQDVSAKDKKYAQIMVTKGYLQGIDNYIKPTYAPNPHYEKSLSKTSVKRIREGRGTEADFEALKADIAARENEVGGDVTNPFLSGGL